MKSSHKRYLSRNKSNRNQRLRYKASMMAAHAKERGIAWQLTPEDIIEMWTKQQGKCAYSGKKMYLAVGNGLLWRNWTVSIDRLDPAGYYALPILRFRSSACCT